MASSNLFLGSSPPLPNLRFPGKNSKTQLEVVSRFILVPRAIQSPKEGYPDVPASGSTVKERKKKKNGKLKPNFFQQTIDRWSHRITSKREKLPWELDDVEEEGEVETDDRGGRRDGDDGVRDKIGNFGLGNRLVAAPWVHGVRPRDTHFDSLDKYHTSPKKNEVDRRNADIIPDQSLLDRTNCSSDEDAGNSNSNYNAKVAAVGEAFVYLQDKHSDLVRPVKTKNKSLACSTKTQASSKSTTLDSGRSSEEGSSNGDSSKTGLLCSSSTVLESSSTIYKSNGGITGKAMEIPLKHDQTSTPPAVGMESGISQFDAGNNRFVQTGSVRLGVGADTGKFENCCISSDQKIFDLHSNFGTEECSVSGSTSTVLSASLPWKRDRDQGERNILRERSNTELAEKTIPEPELRRLRNLGLRIKERTKVSNAGVTETLVNSIREKWKEIEVVKLKSEGAPAINMKRTHDTLERKTGGLVIWRSGSSVVLYRGMTYDLPCVQSYPERGYTKQKLDFSTEEISSNSPTKARELPNSGNINTDLVESFEESVYGDALNIDGFLDALGPRYEDWAGRGPLPIDADLLPSVVTGYKPPLRLLPYKVRLGLSNKEMTYLRRLARTMPPHFALGRNKYHQGLAKAMVKLWEKSLIAKIAIKRGVLNTHNERMAEELKVLTGGVLLSRNKEFIVFYRGNDFLPPTIAEVVEEREKFANVRQDEEDQARERASALLTSKNKLSDVRHVAGTLAETIQAKSDWADEPNDEDREKMMMDTLLAKHASLIRSMEKKLSLAKGKLAKAEKALAKVQEFLEPAELPSDLETLTDEERFLFRKIGLKMRAFLSLGRRGVFDGTIQNMHLHWKFRELVKIIVKGKSFAQVKHVAISLEAESGGVLVSLDKTTQGYAVVVYRGKNYQKPDSLKPNNLLSRRKALERSIELQRLEALKHHISNLLGKIGMMKSELEQMEKRNVTEESDFTKLDVVFSSEGDSVDDEGDEAYLQTYKMEDTDGDDDDAESKTNDEVDINESSASSENREAR